MGAQTGAGQVARRAGRALGAAWHGRVGDRRGCAAGRGRRAGGRAGAQGARARGGGARQGRGSRSGAHGLGAGRAACAHGLGQLGTRAPDSVFNLVFRLGIFPESPNEHCSL